MLINLREGNHTMTIQIASLHLEDPLTEIMTEIKKRDNKRDLVIMGFIVMGVLTAAAITRFANTNIFAPFNSGEITILASLVWILIILFYIVRKETTPSFYRAVDVKIYAYLTAKYGYTFLPEKDLFVRPDVNRKIMSTVKVLSPEGKEGFVELHNFENRMIVMYAADKPLIKPLF